MMTGWIEKEKRKKERDRERELKGGKKNIIFS